jgi:putative phage-type endonuclease
MVGRSPGKYFKLNMVRRKIIATKRKNNIKKICRKKLDFSNTANDYDYGPNAAELDISEEDLKLKMNLLLEKLNKEAENEQIIKEIEKKTIGQSDNIEWHEIRKNRLTASQFGKVITRRPNTPCHNLVKSLLYPKHLISKHIEFGRKNESVAIKIFEKNTTFTVQKCGFFIYNEHKFLGASPDGIIDDDTIIEVKCAPSIGNQSLFEAAKNKKPFCLEIYNSSQLRLKKKHSYYWQIQGQLNITKRSKCAFILYTLANDIYVEWILKDEQLWNEIMLPKLISFYKNCILPEIVDSRLPRGMKIKDPPNFDECNSIRKINK